MKKSLVFILIICSVGAYAGSISDINNQLNAFHSNLAENRLLVRHELKRHMSKFEKTNNRADLKIYLNTLMSKSRTMNVSNDSKNMIKNMSQALIANLAVEKIKATLPPEVVPAIVTTKDDKNIIGEIALSKESESVTKSNVEEVINAPVENQKSPALFGVLFILVASILAGIKLYSRRRKHDQAHDLSQKVEDFSFQDALKGRRPLSSLENLKTPVILIDDKEVIRWVNKKAKENLGFNKGESFFLEHELSFNNENSALSYEQSGKEFDITVRYSVMKKCKILTFIPLFESAYSSVSEVEGSLPLNGIVNEAVMKSEYLFTNSGIPLIIDNRLSETLLADEKVNGVISKTLKLAYDMSKNIKGSRVDYILDEIDGTSFVQIDFKNQVVKNLKWENPINEEDFSLAEAWGELELSLADRQGRLFYFDDEKVKGMSFQLMFEKTQVTVGSLA